MNMDLEATFQRGFEYRCAGQYTNSREEFQKILAVNASHVGARHQMGLIQGFEGDFDGSLETLSKLCNEYPKNNDIRYDFAMTQMMLGMSDEACENFRVILTNDPHHEKAKQQIVYC